MPPTTRSVVFTITLCAASVAMSQSASAVTPLSGATRARVLDSGRVGAGVVNALDAQDRVRVIVVFGLPGGKRSSALDPSLRSTTIANTRTAIVSALGPTDFTLRRAYDAIDAMAGEVTAVANSSSGQRLSLATM